MERFYNEVVGRGYERRETVFMNDIPKDNLYHIYEVFEKIIRKGDQVGINEEYETIELYLHSSEGMVTIIVGEPDIPYEDEHPNWYWRNYVNK